MRKIFFLCALCASVAMYAQTPAIGDQFDIDESGTGGHIIHYEVTSVGPNEVKVAAGGHTIAAGVKLEIPAEVTYNELTWAVTELEYEAFYENNALSEVLLPNTITTISVRAFANSSMTKITVPASVTNINDGALAGCSNLTEVIFEDASNISVGWNSFNYSKILTDQTNNGVHRIGDLAVTWQSPDNAWPEILEIPEGIVNIAAGFRYNSNVTIFSTLKKIVLPSTLKRIHDNAFASDDEQKMTNLETVVVKATAVPFVNDAEHLTLPTDQTLTLVVPCGKKAIYEASDMWNTPYDAIEEDCTTALDETATDASAVKRIVNGQMVIEREGKVFNALGSEVK